MAIQLIVTKSRSRPNLANPAAIELRELSSVDAAWIPHKYFTRLCIKKAKRVQLVTGARCLKRLSAHMGHRGHRRSTNAIKSHSCHPRHKRKGAWVPPKNKQSSAGTNFDHYSGTSSSTTFCTGSAGNSGDDNNWNWNPFNNNDKPSIQPCEHEWSGDMFIDPANKPPMFHGCAPLFRLAAFRICEWCRLVRCVICGTVQRGPVSPVLAPMPPGHGGGGGWPL